MGDGGDGFGDDGVAARAVEVALWRPVALDALMMVSPRRSPWVTSSPRAARASLGAS